MKLYSYPITSPKHEQGQYNNLSFQKTEESGLKHQLLSPSIYKGDILIHLHLPFQLNMNKNSIRTSVNLKRQGKEF